MKYLMMALFSLSVFATETERSTSINYTPAVTYYCVSSTTSSYQYDLMVQFKKEGLNGATTFTELVRTESWGYCIDLMTQANSAVNPNKL